MWVIMTNSSENFRARENVVRPNIPPCSNKNETEEKKLRILIIVQG